MRKDLKNDVVIQLITGRNVKIVDFKTGKTVEEFKPTKINRYPVLDSLRSDNVSEDAIMVSEGLRNRLIHINREEFTHTSEEKVKIKEGKALWKKECIANGNSKFKMTTIVHVKC